MRNIFSSLLRQIVDPPFRGGNIQKGVPYENVAFVPKAYPGDPSPWETFGSTEEEYRKWIPEVCGICCLKMASDTFGLAAGSSLYDLTLRCLEKGGFRIQEDGSILGVFHHPLIDLAKDIGLRGSVEKMLDTTQIERYLTDNRMIILSIDLAKATSSFKGNHLILVHRYLPEEGLFLANDCAFAIGESGFDIPLPVDLLERISNRRGMTIWKEAN
jgi:hypothetical protein